MRIIKARNCLIKITLFWSFRTPVTSTVLEPMLEYACCIDDPSFAASKHATLLQLEYFYCSYGTLEARLQIFLPTVSVVADILQYAIR